MGVCYCYGLEGGGGCYCYCLEGGGFVMVWVGSRVGEGMEVINRGIGGGGG